MEPTSSYGPALVTPLYEQDELSLLTGGTLRPGGIALTTEILTCCKPSPGCTVLDVGCGPGHTVALMTTVFGLRATGLDPSAAMLAKAACQTPDATFFQGEATAIPCKSHSFEMVISECVLSLTGDIEKSLREMSRVLRPGGLLILTDIYCKQSGLKPDLPNLQSCISSALPLEIIEKGLYNAGFTLHTLRDRSDLLKQLAGQIIFSYGSLEKFWQLFMGAEAARRTSCALATVPLGYYVLIAEKGANNG
jgi:ubiquinone/menaquinone biosynthesis C-methylase UbiE